MSDGKKSWAEEEEESSRRIELKRYENKTPAQIHKFVVDLEKQLEYLNISDLQLTRNQFYSIDKLNQAVADFKQEK